MSGLLTEEQKDLVRDAIAVIRHVPASEVFGALEMEGREVKSPGELIDDLRELVTR